MDDTNTTTVGHAKTDSTDEYIGRSNGNGTMRTKEVGEHGWLGNPYVEVDNATDAHLEDLEIDIVPDRETAIEEFRKEFIRRLTTNADLRGAVADLSGATLGGWCRTADDDGPACHGDVIADIADQLAVYQNTDPDNFVSPDTWGYDD